MQDVQPHPLTKQGQRLLLSPDPLHETKHRQHLSFPFGEGPAGMDEEVEGRSGVGESSGRGGGSPGTSLEEEDEDSSDSPEEDGE